MEPVRELERVVVYGLGVTGKYQLELRERSQFSLLLILLLLLFFLSSHFCRKLFLSQPMIFTFCVPKSSALGRGRSEQVAHSLEWFQWEQ